MRHTKYGCNVCNGYNVWHAKYGCNAVMDVTFDTRSTDVTFSSDVNKLVTTLNYYCNYWVVSVS